MVISMLDGYGRDINYMRVSVTDKCNLRCRYCMPEGIEIVPMTSLLSFEEITTVCRLASDLGIDRIKITGGEPLVRKGVTDLIAMLKDLPGIRQVTMTSNGILLGRFLPDLLKAGLDGVNISLDTMSPKTYQTITGSDRIEDVLSGIFAACESGLRVKINSVLMKGINEKDWESLIQLAKDQPIDVRFIEMMPIGAGAAFESVSNVNILSQINRSYPDVSKDLSVHGNGPAVYYRIPGFAGTVGFISAIHGKFCDSCNRIRMTAIGDLKPCLCYATSFNIRDTLRQESEEAVKSVLKEVILQKPKAHCFEDKDQITEKSRMVGIGG